MPNDTICIYDAGLFALPSFRRQCIDDEIFQFGATRIVVSNCRILNITLFDTLEIALSARHVNEFIADGSYWVPIKSKGDDPHRIVPIISNAAVELLARHRFARRLTSLNLWYNDLGNDAARAIARSPYLDNLKSLQLMQGNRIRGRVWQEVVERFGEDVVS